MRQAVFPLFSAYIEKITGASAARVSESVISHTAQLLMAEWGCASEGELIRLAETSPEVRLQLINKTTLTATYFFRESEYMDLAIREVYPRLRETKKPDNILSAGCSTGAEVYSVAILLHELYGLAEVSNWRVLGIDIDPVCIAAARQASYTQHTLREMSRGGVFTIGFLSLYLVAL